jgi:orotate phosphoribosyltransferase
MTADRTRIARRIGETSRLTGTFTLLSGQLSDSYFHKFCVIDREAGATEAVAGAGLPLLSVFRMSEIR